jgi:ribosome-associated protein
MQEIEIKTETINLDQFLKWAQITDTGGEAKSIIQAGKIKVNQELETRRSRTLKAGDIIEYAGNKYKVVDS